MKRILPILIIFAQTSTLYAMNAEKEKFEFQDYQLPCGEQEQRLARYIRDKLFDQQSTIELPTAIKKAADERVLAAQVVFREKLQRLEDRNDLLDLPEIKDIYRNDIILDFIDILVLYVTNPPTKVDLSTAMHEVASASRGELNWSRPRKIVAPNKQFEWNEAFEKDFREYLPLRIRALFTNDQVTQCLPPKEAAWQALKLTSDRKHTWIDVFNRFDELSRLYQDNPEELSHIKTAYVALNSHFEAIGYWHIDSNAPMLAHTKKNEIIKKYLCFPFSADANLYSIKGLAKYFAAFGHPLDVVITLISDDLLEKYFKAWKDQSGPVGKRAADAKQNLDLITRDRAYHVLAAVWLKGNEILLKEAQKAYFGLTRDPEAPSVSETFLRAYVMLLNRFDSQARGDIEELFIHIIVASWKKKLSEQQMLQLVNDLITVDAHDTDEVIKILTPYAAILDIPAENTYATQPLDMPLRP